MPQSQAPQNVVLLDAVTAAVASRAVNPDGRIYLTWQYKTTGSPTGVNIRLEGSLDGTNWEVVGTAQTDTSGMLVYSTTAIPLSFTRIQLITLTGGTNPTVTARLLTS
ncbi:hypothetical protein LCGC14_0552560 [marine sediment metagenome]|uniref:F5/8 type C domain-containing protein n=1 Tax=marine sediment metagenome TaxID=412755 RepID=A0A0F9UXV6_9ZZZZ